MLSILVFLSANILPVMFALRFYRTEDALENAKLIFLWNKLLSIYNYGKIDTCKFQSSQKYESRNKLAASLQACREARGDFVVFWTEF